MKTKTAVSAGGVIVDDQGRVALTQRRSFSGDLKWGLPKGTVEQGESLQEAAAREAKEETGLEVAVVGELSKIDYWYIQPASQDAPQMRVHKFVHFFLMRAVGGDPTAHDDETELVEMVTFDEAIARTSFRSEKPVLEAAKRLTATPP